MNLGLRILKNTFYLTLGDKLGYLLQFVFFLFFARKFGVVPSGEYSFGFTYAYAFFVIADLGISVYLVREVARSDPANRQMFADCLLLRSVGVIGSFSLAAGIWALFFGDISPQKLRVIGFWAAYWIFYSLADVFLTELKGHERMGQVAALGLLLKVLSTGAGIVLIYLGLDYDRVLIVLPISSLIYLCLCILCSYHYLGSFPLKIMPLSHYRKLLGELWPFFFTIVLVEILYVEDILVLGILKEDRSVGIYSSAIKIVSFIIGISPFFHVAMLPTLSRLFLESKKKLVEISNRSLRYLFAIGLPISVGLAVTSGQIIRTLYSERFMEAEIVLKITSWTIAVGFVQAIYSVLLTAINRQKEKVLFIGITFGVSTILNFVLISYFDFIGAAAVKLMGDMLTLIFFIYLVAKYFARLSIWRFALRPSVACVLMGSFATFFRHWNLVYLIPLSVIVYLGAFVALGGVTHDEMKAIGNLVRRNPRGWPT